MPAPRCNRANASTLGYAFPTGYSAFDILVNNTAGFHRSPLLERFDLPSRNNPYGW